MVKSKSTFEKDFERLEEIALKLESGDISLDEALKLFEEGVTLSKRLIETLNNAELKVNQLKRELNGMIKKTSLENNSDEEI
jgi:exodeoxyribonuclease VII small subunit